MEQDERNQMVMANLALVGYMVEQLAGKAPEGMTREDMIQCGYLGLIAAASVYDQDKAQFSTFACMKIDSAIKQGMKRYSWVLPERKRHLKKKTSAPEYCGVDALGNRAIRGTGIRKPQGPPLSLELLTTIADTRMHPLERQWENEALEDAIDALPAEERDVIRLHYFGGLLMKEIALLSGRSCNWVCTLHQRALRHLKELMKE